SDRGYRQAGPIPRGRRNDTLTKIAGAHRRSGSSSEAIEAALLVINSERCRPPLAASEVRKIARSIGRRRGAPKLAVDGVGYVADLAGAGIPLTPTQRLVLATLCHRANDDGLVLGGSWLETETGYGRRAVREAITALEGQGLLTVTRKHRSANRITLFLPDDSAPLPITVVVGGPEGTTTGARQ